MNRFDEFKRWAWSIVVVLALAFTLVGCSGDDGKNGAAGTNGQPGADGQSCWDLNGNGAGDVATEDINGDGTVDVTDCGVSSDPIAAAVEKAQIESCATCHGGVGEEQHQGLYDGYTDTSLAMTIDNVTSVADGVGGFDVTAEFTITKNGLPFVDTPDLQSLNQKSFYAVQHFAATQEYLHSCSLRNRAAVSATDGKYSVTGNCPYAPEAGDAQVYGYIAQNSLFEHTGVGGEFSETTHVHLYDDVANAAKAFGTAADTDASAYLSPANVAGCQKCHGTPYLKHGYRAAEVTGIPDFAACKSCHYDDRNGGHEDWQYMVDDPFNWATDALAADVVETKYAYKAKLMNDVHMAHSMEFPYPQSMANCVTCHEGKLDVVLDNSNFQMATCRSCHPIEGNGAWPGEKYNQSHRAPPFAYLWQEEADLTFHELLINGDCTECHGNPDTIDAPKFRDFHSGYDTRIYDDTGQRYADLFDASIDGVSVAGDVVTIAFSADDSAIANAVAGSLNVHVYVSFYGWDTKHFIVPSHQRDGSGACQSWSNGVSGTQDCRYEMSTLGYTDDPANADPSLAYNPLFPSLTEVAPGSWELEVDMSAWVNGQPGTVPEMIANGKIRRAEITLAPRLDAINFHGHEVAVGLNAVTQTFDPVSGALIADHFKGADAVVSVTGGVDQGGCNDCHDQLAVTFHGGSGRGGDIVACKNCHAPVFDGSHLELASRSIENYVHAIHSFQNFDTDDVFNDRVNNADVPGFDPVLAKRYDMHKEHVFPNFTIRNCEACHLDGKFNAPDQSASLPGVLSETYDVLTWYKVLEDTGTGNFLEEEVVEDPAGRKIHGVPSYVVGPASRACGGCHRADLINEDAAGDLAAFNAHTQAFGTLVENDSDDQILFGIIDKIMTWFE